MQDLIKFRQNLKKQLSAVRNCGKKDTKEAVVLQIKNLSAAQVQPFGEILSAESELLPPCAERWQIRPGADVRELQRRRAGRAGLCFGYAAAGDL